MRKIKKGDVWFSACSNLWICEEEGDRCSFYNDGIDCWSRYFLDKEERFIKGDTFLFNIMDIKPQFNKMESYENK